MQAVSRTIHGIVVRVSMISVFAMLFVLAASSGGEDADIDYLEGVARVRKAGSEGWLKIGESTIISTGDSAMTLADSRFEVLIPKNGVFRMGPASSVLFDSDLAAWYTFPELVSGDIWGVFQYEDNRVLRSLPRTMLPVAEIMTDSAVARFSAGNDCSAEIKVYSGHLQVIRRKWFGYQVEREGEEIERHPCRADFSEPDSLRNWKVTLGAGDKLILSSKGHIVYQGSFHPDDPDEDTDWVHWNKERDQSR